MTMAAMLFLCTLSSLAQAGVAPSGMDRCGECHAEHKPSSGPSFLQVSVRYRDDPEAPEFLARNIKDGVKGKWGKGRHPRLDLTEKKAKAYALRILALREPAASSPKP